MYFYLSSASLPGGTSVSNQISSRKKCLVKHPAFLRHSRHTPYVPHSQLQPLLKRPQFSSSIIQDGIRCAKLLRTYSSLYRAFRALMYFHAALLRAHSVR